VYMTFESSGTLRFKGGYLFYNPSRWAKVAGDPKLIQIRLGGKQAFPTRVAKQQLEGNPTGSLASFDERARSLVYRIGFGNAPIEFGGLIFYREAKCDA
jgi:hypothetical protein